MAALLDQLRRLHGDLQVLVDRDPEQEVQGIALPLLDSVLAEARNSLPEGSTLGPQIVDLISPEAVASGDPIRAADALLVVGQVLAVYEHEHVLQVARGVGEANRRLARPSGWDI